MEVRLLKTAIVLKGLFLVFNLAKKLIKEVEKKIHLPLLRKIVLTI